jgi:Trk K+ transport system NAD-binding subunit
MKHENEKQRILVVGLGDFGRELLKFLSPEWDIAAVDINEKRLSRCAEKFPAGEGVNVEYLTGAADSAVTWKKLDVQGLKYIISTLKDTEVNLELCRIAREVLHLKIPVIVLTYGDVDPGLYAPFDVRPVNSFNAGIQAVLKRLDRHVIRAVNMGLEKGELLEVTVKARSHLVDRKLKHLRPSRWHISALYREGKLILPDGNSCLKVGDRVVMVGDPNLLEEITEILLKGKPQFPLQYGSNIVFPLHVDFACNMDETIYWLNSFKAGRIRFLPFKKKLSPAFTQKIKADVTHFEIGETIELFKEVFNLPVYKETGVLVIPMCGGLRKSRVREAFKKSRKPFLLSRLTYPYQGVVISFNGPDPGQAMEAGIEIARMLDISFRVVCVTLPKEMRGMEEDKHLRLRRSIISDFEGIYKKHIDYTVLEGNPVRETLKFLAPLDNHLLVTVTDANAPLSYFKPNVTYLVAQHTHLSTLVIPEAETHE